MENGRENSLMEGPVEQYHRNGQLRVRRVYSRGSVVDSVVPVLNDDGTLSKTEEWVGGRCRCYGANRRLVSEFGLLNGKYHGRFKVYHENGNLFIDTTFGDNGPEGEFARYYPNGNPREKCHYSNGILDGEETLYYENGTLRRRSVYKMGLLTGKSTCYHENGRLIWEREFENGIVKDGSVTVYDSEGNIIINEIWENGIMHSYSAGGDIVHKGGYMNFDEVGEHVKYHRNGQVHKKMHYSMGRLDGVTQIYDEYGSLYCEIPYENDRREGFLKTYNPDGTVETESLYADDQYCGGKEYSYDDGVLRSQCEMNCELPEGEELEFHENGAIASKSFYRHGMPVEGRNERRDENGNLDGYYEYKNGMWRFYSPEGELRMEWQCYRNRCNGSCHINDPEAGTYEGYMMNDEPCETLEEFLDMTFDLLAAKCADRFGDIHSEDDFKEFFASAYEKAANSIAAQVEYDDYAELEACFTRNLPDDRYVDYLVREFVLRLRLPNDGDTERDIAQGLREMVGI